MFSISNWIKSETPPQVSIVATSPRIEALKTARDSVAANENGSNVAQIIPEPISSMQPRKLDTNKLIGKVTLPVPQNDNSSAPIGLTQLQTPSITVLVPPAEIAPDHLLEAKISDAEKIIPPSDPEVVVLTKPIEPHFSVKIDGQNESIRNFLPEIFNLFKVGKELDALIIKRREEGEVAEKAKAESNSAAKQASLIRSSMSDFFQSTNLETSREKLKEALEAYEKFLAAFETDKVGQDNLLRGADNKLLVQINSAKASLSGLIKVVGSREIFDTIKEKVFKALNKLRGSIPGYESKIIQDLHKVLDQKKPADAKILRDLAQSKEEGRIIDIFKILYGM